MNNKVDKKIHLIWFGEKPLPEAFLNNYLSIKSYAPEYEIFVWNEKNLNVFKNEYTSICFENKWYAHLCDYFRIEVVWKHGGIYLDIDLLLITTIKGSFIEYPTFPYNDVLVGGKLIRMYGSGWGFSSYKNSILLKEILTSYERFDTRAIKFDLSIPTWTDISHQSPIIENFIHRNNNNILESWNFVPLNLLNKYIKTLNFASWMTQDEVERSEFITDNVSRLGFFSFFKVIISFVSYIHIYGFMIGLKYIFNRIISRILMKFLNKSK